ncbi:pheST operon leader peptide PheM [Salmonella enterica]
MTAAIFRFFFSFST